MNAFHKIYVAATLGAIVATTAIVYANPSDALRAQASVTPERARAIAMRVVPGTIVSEELEKEAGGSGLRYTFDIRGAHGVREVGIDAKSGRTLENSVDRDTSNTTPSEGPEGSGD